MAVDRAAAFAGSSREMGAVVPTDRVTCPIRAKSRRSHGVH